MNDRETSLMMGTLFLVGPVAFFMGNFFGHGFTITNPNIFLTAMGAICIIIGIGWMYLAHIQRGA